MIDFILRPATRDDIDYLWALRQRTMKTYIETSYGWNESEEYGCAIQSLSCTRVILVKDEPIGIVKLEAYDDYDQLLQIQIDPLWANREIGSGVIGDIINEARNKKKKVRLHVLKINPALKLYARMGFVAISESIHQLTMEHAATTAV